jgi:hypothetical protein
MNIEKSIEILKKFRNYNKFYKEENKDLTITITLEAKESIDKAIERLLTAYEKEKEKNKKAIDFINERKKIVNKDIAEGTRLQVGTFMWQVDELLEVLKGVEEE